MPGLSSIKSYLHCLEIDLPNPFYPFNICRIVFILLLLITLTRGLCFIDLFEEPALDFIFCIFCFFVWSVSILIFIISSFLFALDLIVSS